MLLYKIIRFISVHQLTGKRNRQQTNYIHLYMMDFRVLIKTKLQISRVIEPTILQNHFGKSAVIYPRPHLRRTFRISPFSEGSCRDIHLRFKFRGQAGIS